MDSVNDTIDALIRENSESPFFAEYAESLESLEEEILMARDEAEKK